MCRNYIAIQISIHVAFIQNSMTCQVLMGFSLNPWNVSTFILCVNKWFKLNALLSYTLYYVSCQFKTTMEALTALKSIRLISHFYFFYIAYFKG